MNELDKYLRAKIKEYRKQGKSEDWIRRMTAVFNKHRSDRKEKK